MNQTDIFLNWWKERNSRPGFYGSATVKGITVKVHKGVYSPDPSCTHASTMLMGILSNLEGKKVLDIGTGTGILAIYAAQQGAEKVTAVDIQPEAIENTLENVADFGYSKIIDVFISDVFEKVSGTYDIIIANLPIMDPEWTELNQIATDTNSRFFDQLKSYLSPEGRAYICGSSWSDMATLKKMISKSKLSFAEYTEDARQATWYIYELKNSTSCEQLNT